MEMEESSLVRLCLDEACKSRDAVELWRLQRRSLERLPPHLADALLRRLLHQRLLFPSLLEVFKQSVENIDLRGESSINAEWLAYIGGFVNLVSLNLSDCMRINNSILWPITGLTSLTELDLSRCSKVTNAGIKHLQSVVNLEKLWISQTGVTEAGITLLASLKKLSLLDLGGLPVTDHNLSSLQALTKLEYLDIWGSNVTNQGANSILKISNLSFLNLSWTSVTQIPNLPHLECLHMNQCAIVSILKTHSLPLASLKKLVLSGATLSAKTDAFSYINKSSITYLDVSKTPVQNFSFLETMRQLEYLDLSSTAFGDDSVEFVACVGNNLRNLNVSDTKITSAGVGNLAGHVPQLETFSLSHTFVDDLSILLISTMMPCVRALDLSMTSIRGFIQQQSPQEEESKPSLAALQSLTFLKTLSLEHPYLSDTALSPLSCLTGLTHLSLRSTSLTDSILHHLSSLPNLISLGVQDAVLTNNGLEKFRAPLMLRTLDLKGCWLLTKDAIAGLCKRYPHIKVRHEFAHEASSLDQNQLRPRSSTPQSFTKVTKRRNNQKPTTSIAVSRSFLDQRVRYNREELVALQNSPLSRVFPQEGELISVPDILADSVTLTVLTNHSPANYQSRMEDGGDVTKAVTVSSKSAEEEVSSSQGWKASTSKREGSEVVSIAEQQDNDPDYVEEQPLAKHRPSRPPSPSLTAQRLIREQQDDEYLASLEADRKKAEARRLEEETARVEALEEEKRKEEEARRKVEEEQAIERQLVSKEASLPQEPPAGEENAVALLVRLPDGTRHGRRFLKSDKLQSLFDFIDICRVVKPNTYRLIKPYPRHAFGVGESLSTLSDVGLTSKQEALFLEFI